MVHKILKVQQAAKCAEKFKSILQPREFQGEVNGYTDICNHFK